MIDGFSEKNTEVESDVRENDWAEMLCVARAGDREAGVLSDHVQDGPG